MPFAFSQVSPKNTGRVSRVEIPFTNYLGVAFEQGMHDSMFASISQIREMDLEREGPRITADEANERYGLPGLKFDTSVYESEAKLINERKQAEMRRNFYLEQGAPGGTWSKRGLAGLGTSMIASMLNPLDFSMNFMPVVGSEKMALQAQRLGRGAFRQALARGLLTTEEAIARRIPIAPRLTSSLIQGFVGNVAAEVPHFISAVQSKENYTFTDALTNVGAGTILGGALHLVVTSAARVLEKTTMATRDAMMNKAMDDFVKGESPDVAHLVNIDENVIREQVKFDEKTARQTAAAQVDAELRPEMSSQLKQEGVTPENIKAIFDGTKSVDQVVEEQLGIGKETILENNDGSRTIIIPPDAGPTATTGSHIGTMSHTDAINLAKDSAVTRINDILGIAQNFDDEPKIAQIRDQRIQELVELARKEAHESARNAEIARQIEEGKTLTDTQKKDFGFTEDKAKAEATVKEQTTELKKQIEQLDEETVVNDLTKEELDQVKSIQKGIEQAIDCVLKNIP